MSFATALPTHLTPHELPSVELSATAAAGPSIGDSVHASCGSCGAKTTCVFERVTTPPPAEILPLCDYCSSGPTPWP